MTHRRVGFSAGYSGGHNGVNNNTNDNYSSSNNNNSKYNNNNNNNNCNTGAGVGASTVVKPGLPPTRQYTSAKQQSERPPDCKLVDKSLAARFGFARV